MNRIMNPITKLLNRPIFQPIAVVVGGVAVCLLGAGLVRASDHGAAHAPAPAATKEHSHAPAPGAEAKKEQPAVTAQIPSTPQLGVCGVLEDFGGDAQILDSSRNQLLDTDVRTAIPCGAWISTESGWAKVSHRDGYRLVIGQQSFVELTDTEVASESETEKDPVVLYRGQLRVVAASGATAEEVRILTPHARVRIKSGQAAVVYSQAEEETQVIALQEAAILENRFEPQNRVRIRTGEASSLNFKAQRVAPEVPKAVAITSLRQKLVDLRADDHERTELIAVIKNRHSRKNSAVAAAGAKKKIMEHELEHESAQDRLPAGLELEKERSEYRRHPPQPGDATAHKHWVRRLTGGSSDGETILNPSEASRHPQGLQLSVDGGTPSKKEDAAKAQLLREISQLRVD